MVSTLPIIFESSTICTNRLMTVPIARITIGINVTFMFHSFFNSLGKSMYLSFFSLSFNYTLLSAGTAESTILLVLYCFMIIIRSVRLAKILGSVCISKSQRSLCVLFSTTGSGLCIFVRIVKLQFLAQFPMDHLAHLVVPNFRFFVC